MHHDHCPTTGVARAHVAAVQVTCIYAMMAHNLFHLRFPERFGNFSSSLFTMFQVPAHPLPSPSLKSESESGIPDCVSGEPGAAASLMTRMTVTQC